MIGQFGAQGRNTPTDTNKLPKAAPSMLGSPFHNPYSFIPFPETPPSRGNPTPHTVDERSDEAARFTGIIELRLRTESPLLSKQAESEEEKQGKDADNGHRTYRSLTIGNDVIIPAASIRGFLRYLMTIVTGGPLTQLDPYMHLCQGRDARLGPPCEKNPDPTVPQRPFLASIVRPGDIFSPGTIRLGQTRLRRVEKLQVAFRGKIDEFRPTAKPRPQCLWAQLDANGNVLSIQDRRNEDHQWQVKLSGRPVNRKFKREGLFLDDGIELELPAEFWAEYTARNRCGDHPTLRENDLIWLEPADKDLQTITCVEDISSIQWARWGRRGQSVLDGKVMPGHLHPDFMRDDGDVAMVTDLFGQASSHRDHQSAPQFAGRIRPDNCVFHNAKAQLFGPEPLAVMNAPHPGCIPFYRQCDDMDQVGTDSRLRGYKVYRTSQHAGSDDPEAPWRFENQGTYADNGRLQTDPRQKVNISAELLREGAQGTLRLSVRALSQVELDLLLLLCSPDSVWRLGGGKPLGLGLCRIESAQLFDEMGAKVEIPADLTNRMGPEMVRRFHLWNALQRPVESLRYPRAVNRNRNKNSRGGLVWFQQFAQPKQTSKEEHKFVGLRPIYVCDGLADEARKHGADNHRLGAADMIAGQCLPPFDPDHLDADLLYGYDLILVADGAGDNDHLRRLEAKTREFNCNTQKNCYPTVEPFDPDKHIAGNEKSGGPQGQSADTRNRYKRDRGED